MKDPDQYSTDFTKALLAVRSTYKGPPLEAVVIFGGLGGRVDQAFAQLHQLYASEVETAPGATDRLDLFLIAGDSIVFLLREGRNVVHTRRTEGSALGRNVGIIPLAGPAVISTEGLEWDVKDWRTSFGTQLSTSNYVVKDDIVVTTNERVLFSIDFGKHTEGNRPKDFLSTRLPPSRV